MKNKDKFNTLHEAVEAFDKPLYSPQKFIDWLDRDTIPTWIRPGQWVQGRFYTDCLLEIDKLDPSDDKVHFTRAFPEPISKMEELYHPVTIVPWDLETLARHMREHKIFEFERNRVRLRKVYERDTGTVCVQLDNPDGRVLTTEKFSKLCTFANVNPCGTVVPMKEQT